MNPNCTIDTEHFTTAVRATIYNEPHLRADVDLTTNPATWCPATDFGSVFEFRDLRESGAVDVEGVRDLADEEVNAPWQYSSGKPLYRCVLCQIIGGYVVMNIYHHSAGDGNTGLLIAASLMKQYNLLLEGKPLHCNPQQPRPCIEDYTLLEGEEEETNKMIEEKVERTNKFSSYLPFDKEEFATNVALDLPLNKTLIREGGADNFDAVRKKCKQHQVTIGNLFLASAYMAMGTLHAETQVSDLDAYEGMKDQYIDLPVNMRSRLQPTFNDYCGFYITEATTKFSVDNNSTLWTLAQHIQKKMGDDFAAKHIFFSPKLKTNGRQDCMRICRRVDHRKKRSTFYSVT